MSKLLALTAILILAMLGGPLLINNPGYIKIVVAGYTIEMTLLGLVLALFVLAIIVFTLYFMVKKLARWQHKSFSFLRGRRQRKARAAFASGLQAYARQQWQLASEQLQLSLQDGQYLNEKRMLASYASLYAGNSQQATTLAITLDTTDSNSAFVQADLLLQQGQPGQACQLLASHVNATNRDKALGQLYLQALQQAGQWRQLLHTIPLALQQQWFSKAEWPQQRFAMYPRAIAHLSMPQGFSAEADYWQTLPTKERKSSAAMLGVAWADAQAGLSEQAEQKLVQILTLGELPAAWPYLRQIPLGRSVLKLRKAVQHWLRDNPTNGYLFAVLAYLAEQEGDREQAAMAWQKVKQYQPELC
ncbi:heme biosynthesis HemY N-terminal domain-containing protein [Alishewanella tabrizica]|uniref:HemY N-terminal domain-containing protein n=1 Tax=Alishewanella tabrizica TaxID=671278 RepID=A0ABQ2WR16_9ALTE|nr:heme biosynthesis HemY N-terminal domain-containing protein [Alishewanella tabrizica]GGW69297.1 hypothetical protein GCM10008111_26760 [Alishewanella tabrizica]